MALNEFGKSYEGTVSIEVPKTDTYQFVFVSGTWDQSMMLAPGLLPI